MFAKLITNLINILFKRQPEPTQAYTETKYPYKNTLTMATISLTLLDSHIAQKYWVDAKYMRKAYGTESFAEFWYQLKLNITEHGGAYLEFIEGEDYSEFLDQLEREGWLSTFPSGGLPGILHLSKVIYEKHDVTPNYG